MGTMEDAQAEAAALEAKGEVREVKVKLPTEQVLRLHFTRMAKHTNFSQIVSTALTRYFDELAHGK